MISVQLRYFAGAAEAAGVSSVRLTLPDGATVADVLANRSTPELDRVLDFCSVLVNGVRSDDHSAALPTGDVLVDVLPPFAGG